MKIKESVIERINNPGMRSRIAAAHNIGEPGVVRWVTANKPNGPLTTITSLRVIMDELGLSQDEILEQPPKRVYPKRDGLKTG